MTCHARQQGGQTLTETVIVIALVSTAAVTVTAAFGRLFDELTHGAMVFIALPLP
ncbi:MAG: hypothetical protein JSV26_06060 [bacterium]|nr:MAG: hypothetical protein JSV26_06060 [bacterium]